MFLYPTISRHFIYDRIPRSLEIEAILVDLGTFISQDLHKSVLDGAPSTNMYGLDTVNHWGLGFDMFRDHEKFHAHCIEGDILIRVRKNATENVYHLGDLRFTSMDMVRAAKTLVDLSKVGIWVVGYQVGGSLTFFQERTELVKGDNWLHDPESSGECGMKLGKKRDQSGTLQLRLKLSRRWDENRRMCLRVRKI
ncbi:putative methyltransferase domain-containing protein [Botrytis fragariae]|uniref:Putative methyltransferase domain-containing protein n=1 Tax=Botrytis fragariae TaxID=1964551 RepID=A0A8H6AI69_9HELO|nr:putative methyltransferase domain-containing protein [Botrytis fragariae]KAF5868238.1 putative methyltransferase domain-containing protein [Botrytis fragariae]